MTRHPVKSLYVFDIDDTLFRTSARARVVNTKGQVKYLSSEELKDYEFSASEKICFAEFRDAKKFAEESQPIESMIKIAQDCIQKTAEGSKTILLTARLIGDNPLVDFDLNSLIAVRSSLNKIGLTNLANKITQEIMTSKIVNL